MILSVQCLMWRDHPHPTCWWSQSRGVLESKAKVLSQFFVSVSRGLEGLGEGTVQEQRGQHLPGAQAAGYLISQRYWYSVRSLAKHIIHKVSINHKIDSCCEQVNVFVLWIKTCLIAKLLTKNQCLTFDWTHLFKQHIAEYLSKVTVFH